MLTLVLGFNPINMRGTDRTAANFLRALIELVPGGADHHAGARQPRRHQQGGRVGRAEGRRARRHRRADRRGAEAVHRLAGLGRHPRPRRRVGSGEADLHRPDRPADLLRRRRRRRAARRWSSRRSCARSPRSPRAPPATTCSRRSSARTRSPAIPCPRTADTLIGGFMKLIGQEEVWQNIKRGNAVARAFAWFQGALAGLMGFVPLDPAADHADAHARSPSRTSSPSSARSARSARRSSAWPAQFGVVGAQPGARPARDPRLGRRARGDAVHREGQGGVPHDRPGPGALRRQPRAGRASSGSRSSPTTSSTT